MFGNAKAERKALESTYEDTCTIIRDIEKEVNGINKHTTIKVAENIICALVTGNNPILQTETAAFFNYTAKIITIPEVNVKAGDRIIVNRFGKIIKYECAGEPAIYETHQEILLLRGDAV